MKIQKSFAVENGKLYLVPTPIGNLEDITLRAINTLKNSDVVFCEDTRVSGFLMKHLGFKKQLIAYHDHNQDESGDRLLSFLEEGKTVALISDAGMPCISDPGFKIVSKAIDENYDVVALPGANAGLTALIASGIVPYPFTFVGFIEKRKMKKIGQLEEYKNLKHALVFYESPHRVFESLETMLEVLGNRKVVVAREVTKKFETYIRGTIDEIISNEPQIKGEVVIIVEGDNGESENLWWKDMSLAEHVNHYIKDGMRSKDAIKEVAKVRNIAKNDVYRSYHV